MLAFVPTPKAPRGELVDLRLPIAWQQACVRGLMKLGRDPSPRTGAQLLRELVEVGLPHLDSLAVAARLLEPSKRSFHVWKPANGWRTRLNIPSALVDRAKAFLRERPSLLACDLDDVVVTAIWRGLLVMFGYSWRPRVDIRVRGAGRLSEFFPSWFQIYDAREAYAKKDRRPPQARPVDYVEPPTLGLESFERGRSVAASIYVPWSWWTSVNETIEQAKSAYVDGKKYMGSARAYRRIFLLGLEKLEQIDPDEHDCLWFQRRQDREKSVVVELPAHVFGRAERLGLRGQRMIEICLSQGLSLWMDEVEKVVERRETARMRTKGEDGMKMRRWQAENGGAS